MPSQNIYSNNRNPAPGNYEYGSIFGGKRGASIGYGNKNPFSLPPINTPSAQKYKPKSANIFQSDP